jgi:hypothetical protein
VVSELGPEEHRQGLDRHQEVLAGGAPLPHRPTVRLPSRCSEHEDGNAGGGSRCGAPPPSPSGHR